MGLNSLLSLILLFVFTSCSSGPREKYRQKYPKDVFSTSLDSLKAYELLKEKMTQCYPHNDDPAVKEGVYGTFDEKTKTGNLYFGLKGGIMGENILYLLDIFPAAKEGATVDLYSKGDFFRRTDELKKNIPKWLDNKQGRCRGNAFQGEFWREI